MAVCKLHCALRKAAFSRKYLNDIQGETIRCVFAADRGFVLSEMSAEGQMLCFSAAVLDNLSLQAVYVSR